MRKILSILALGVALVSVNARALTYTAQIEFVTPLSLIEITPLNMGKFATNGQPGIANSGGSSSGGVSVLTPGHNAEFAVAGSADQVVIIDVSDSGTLTNGTDVISVSYQSPGNTVLTGGASAFQVSADVMIPGSISQGVYSGIYDVTVSYQ